MFIFFTQNTKIFFKYVTLDMKSLFVKWKCVIDLLVLKTARDFDEMVLQIAFSECCGRLF